MDANKICFIACVNDEALYEESLSYIHALDVPPHMEIETIAVKGAFSLTSGYNQAMRNSDAKYKVYLHQDVFVIRKSLIHDLMRIFTVNPQLGLLGLAGSDSIPPDAVWWNSADKRGKVYENHTGRMEELAFREVDGEYASVQALDGMFLATQYDVAWREDVFDGWHYYDLSQCMEFRRAGYDVGVAGQDKPWCIHDCGIVNVRNGFEGYRQRFLQTYGAELLPKVSILIPAYNRPAMFEEALQSALQQDYPHIEIIVCDDSTNDETEWAIQSYLPVYPNLRYIRNERNLGQFENDLKLMELATGEYVNLLMDDDLLHPQKISKMMQHMAAHPEVVLATSRRQLIDESGRPLGDIGSTMPLFQQDIIANGRDVAEHILEAVLNKIGEPTTVLFKKDALKEPFGMYGGRRYGCNVDLASWLNLLAEGKMLYLTEALSSFRIHSQQQQQSAKYSILGTSDFLHQLVNAPIKGLFVEQGLNYFRALRNGLRYYHHIVEKLSDEDKMLPEFKELTEHLERLIRRKDEVASRLPLVSILIPAYNRPHYLELALRSALDQTYSNIEIIVSDDSTNDEVERMIQPYLQQHDHIRYVHNETPNVSHNLQQLLDMAKGKYVNFLMDDDLFHLKKIEIMVESFEKTADAALVTSYRESIDENGEPLPQTALNRKLFDQDTVIDGKVMAEHCLSQLSNLIGEPTTVMFRKEDIKKFGVFNGVKFKFINDLATWMQLMNQGNVVYLASSLSYFRIHENQAQNNAQRKMEPISQWYALVKNARALGYLHSEEAYRQVLFKHLDMSYYLLKEAFLRSGIPSLTNQEVRNVLIEVTSQLTDELGTVS